MSIFVGVVFCGFGFSICEIIYNMATNRVIP